MFQEWSSYFDNCLPLLKHSFEARPLGSSSLKRNKWNEGDKPVTHVYTHGSFQAKHSQGQHDGAHLWELWRIPAGSLSLFLSPKWNTWVIHKDCTSDSAKEAEVERHPIGSNQQGTPDTFMQCQLAAKMNFKGWGLHLKLSWPSLFKEEAQQFYLHLSILPRCVFETYQGRQCFALSTHVAAFNAFRHSQLLKLLSVIRALILRDVGTPICHRCSHTQNQIVRTGESAPPRQFLDMTEVPKSGSNSFRISKSLNMTCS